MRKRRIPVTVHASESIKAGEEWDSWEFVGSIRVSAKPRPWRLAWNLGKKQGWPIRRRIAFARGRRVKW